MIITTSEIEEYYFEERCHIKELLNTPEWPDISIAQARVEIGVTTVLHQLEGGEIYYILQGEGLVNIDGQMAKVTSGDVIPIRPNQKQQITNTGKGDLLFLAICSPKFTPAAYAVAKD